MAELNRICSVADCNRRRESATGYCLMHYKRFKRHGSPEYITRAAPNSGLKYLHDLPETDECINWPYATNPDTGYGFVKVNKKAMGAHRYSLSMVVPCPDVSLFALHSCDNRACVNPRHLRWGTQTENVADTVSRGRTAAGEKNGCSKTSQKTVLKLVEYFNDGIQDYGELSRLTGLSRCLLSRILRGERWGSITGIKRSKRPH